MTRCLDVPVPARGRTKARSWTQLGLHYHAIQLSTGRVAYLDEGCGPPVLLLHGAPLTSLGFVRVVRELRSRHRVIAVDLPGFGGSTVGSEFVGSLQSYADFVVEFCSALELDGLVVYGCDTSGAFGIHAAAQMASRVAGIVVADTAPFPLTGWAWPVGLVLRHVVSSRPIRGLNRRWNLFPWLVATVAPLLHRFPAAERRALIEQFPTPAHRDRVMDLFEQMGRDSAFMTRTAELAHRHLARTPTLILWGQFDPMRFLRGNARFRRMFPRSRSCVIPWEEHFPILASGHRVARAVERWIAEEVVR